MGDLLGPSSLTSQEFCMSTESWTNRHQRSYGYRLATVFVGYDQDPPSTFTQTLVALDEGSRTGVSNPNWKVQVRNGVSATTTFYASSSRTTFDSTGTTKVVKGYRDYGNGQLLKKTYNLEEGVLAPIMPYVYPTNVALAEANSAALGEFINKLNEAQRSLQGLVTLGELGETIRLIRNPAKALWEGIFSYHADVKKRLRRRRRRSKREIVQDTWLEYAFGWAPLVNDVKNGAEALAKLMTYRPEYQIVSAFATRKVPRSETIGNGSFGSLYNRVLHQTAIEETTVRYKGSIMVNNHDAISRPNLRLFGITWQDVVPAVWELIPYSFLVDYFLNIGNILDAHALRWADVRWINKTVRTVVTAKSLLTGGSTVELGTDPLFRVEWLDTQVGSAQTSSITKTVTRNAVAGPLIPSLVFSLPSSQSKKWINMAALAKIRN
jgi:hypothetical protein